MLTFCLFALGAITIVLLAVLAEAVHRVSRPPAWRTASRPMDVEAAHTERRRRSLPFVGVERRYRTIQLALDLAEARRAA